MNDNSTTPLFVHWIAAKLGTRRWFVGRWSARLRLQYDVCLSQARYSALYAQYLDQFRRQSP